MVISKDKISEAYKVDSKTLKCEVKRGLRNADGSGVVAGVTRVGDAYGVDGDNNPIHGKLFYRNININKLVDRSFEEVVFLMLLGTLPTEEELADFKKELARRAFLPWTDAKKGNVMNRLAVGVLKLYAYDEKPDSVDLGDVFRHCFDLIARFPLLVASAYRGENVQFNPALSIAENLLCMIRGTSGFTENEAKLLNLALVLHAEHGGGNNSAFSVHTLASSGTDTFSVIAAGLGSLKGPKHGGACAAICDMMDEIKANVKNWSNRDEVYNYLAKIIRKEAGDRSGLIYGMGHAIYTLSDPRAVIFKAKAKALARERGMMNEFRLYMLIEELAPKAFAEIKGNKKPLCANIDFYSGFLYRMLGIPQELVLPLFATARIAGWSAHRIDELVNGGRIIRPAYWDLSRKYIKKRSAANKK